MTPPRSLRVLAVGLLAFGALAPARAKGAAQPFRFETQRVEEFVVRRVAPLVAAFDFDSWPKPSELYPAPAVSRALLREPAVVMKEVRSCTTVAFGDERWPERMWSWEALAVGRKPSADDWLHVRITLAPSARAAQEYLLTLMVSNMLPTESLVAFYKAAKPPESLGTVAFLVQHPEDSRLWFIRANVVFHLWGRGGMSEEVVPLARRLDEHLVDQQPLPLKELRRWIDCGPSAVESYPVQPTR